MTSTAETNRSPDEDIRALRAVFDAAVALPLDQFNAMPALASALNALYEQFEDRLDEADKRARVARLAPTFGESAARSHVYGSED